MKNFPDFSVNAVVADFMSRAVRRSDGKYVAELNEDKPFCGQSEFKISEANWVSVEDPIEDPFQSARALHSENEVSEADNVFLRIGGVITSAGVDLNGVTLEASALTTMPQDFQERTTLLFNHQANSAIGRIVNVRVIGAKGVVPARAVITADVHRAAINPETGMAFAEMIRSGILRKYSLGWNVTRGELVFSFGDDEVEIDEDAGTLTMPIGSDFAPQITIFALTATEASVVSVPALGGAELTVPRAFARSLGKMHADWAETANGLLVPVEILRRTVTIDRPFHVGFALQRVQAWAAGAESTVDLNNENDFARFAQAFAGHENDGRSVEDWYGLHSDVVDGKLVWNKRAVAHCLSELETEQRCADRQRMSRELSIVHGIDIDA